MRRGRNLPHARQELNNTTIAEGKRDGNVGDVHASCSEVDKREHEGCQGESAETERCRVGKLAVLVVPVKTWLELSAECW